jgi:hypothetical protein
MVERAELRERWENCIRSALNLLADRATIVLPSTVVRPIMEYIEETQTWRVSGNEEEPDFSGLLSWSTDHFLELKEVHALSDLVLASPALANALLVDLGGQPVTAKIANWWLPFASIGTFLREYLRRAKSLTYSSNDFNEVYEALEQFVYHLSSISIYGLVEFRQRLWHAE